MSSSCSLSRVGRPVFGRCAENVPLTDMTLYQLALEMEAAEWHWRPWVPPAQRRKKDEPIPDGYKPKDAKVWFSGVEVSRLYLMALLRAEVHRVSVGCLKFETLLISNLGGLG